MILHLPYRVHKNYTGLIVDLNVECDVKLRGESRVDLTDGGVGKRFLQSTQKAFTVREKT